MSKRGLSIAVLMGLLCLIIIACERSYQLEIDASRPWTTTGIEVPNDCVVRIEAAGAISPDGHTYVDADGSDDRDWNSGYNMYKGIKHCALIARVGAGGEVHEIGTRGEIEVTEGGRLLLGVNDRDPDNNEGSFEVTVEVERR